MDKDSYWCFSVDFRNIFWQINLPIYREHPISGDFVKHCLFSKKVMLFDGMTLVCEYDSDYQCKTLGLSFINKDEKYSDLISEINSFFKTVSSLGTIK